MNRQILLIEDEQDIAELLTCHLSDDGADVTHASDGIDGLSTALRQHWDLILLDLSLPRCDGLDICEQIRQHSPSTPVIMVTARSTEQDRIRGLQIGADDYITKPFSISELLARVNALLRRMDALQKRVTPKVITANRIVLNPVTHAVHVDGKSVRLTAKEFELMRHFASSPGEVFGRSELLDRVWGHSHEGYLHTVNTHINRLRAKIEPDPANPQIISTVWGVGYKLTV